MPLFIGAPHPDVYPGSRRSSRAYQQPVEKPTRPRCEIHGDQSRPSTPSDSERSDNSLPRKCCGICPLNEEDCDTSRQKKKRQCSHAPKPPGPAHPPCFAWTSSNSSNTRVATPVAPYHHCYPSSGAPGMKFCSQEHIHDWHHPAHNAVPVENLWDSGLPQAKCNCRPQQPMSPPEFDTCNHCYCGSDECRCDNASFYTLDDGASEYSTEALPGTMKVGNDSQDGSHHCYHPVYVAFPCGTPGME